MPPACFSPTPYLLRVLSAAARKAPPALSCSLTLFACGHGEAITGSGNIVTPIYIQIGFFVFTHTRGRQILYKQDKQAKYKSPIRSKM